MNCKTIGPKNTIHDGKKNAYPIQSNIGFLKSTEQLRESIRLLFSAAIDSNTYPDTHTVTLAELMNNLHTLLDWAWLVQSQSFSWIKERRQWYCGDTNYFGQTAIYSAYLFFADFFGRRSISEWKFILNHWQAYALYPNQNLIEAEVADPYETYQDFEHLQKLVESCWISLQQDKDLRYLEQSIWLDKDNYPLFWTLNLPFNPYEALYQFFHEDPLEVQKGKINAWFSAALDTTPIWTGVSADLTDFYRKIGLLIECCWLIKELGSNYPKCWDTLNSSFSSKRAPENSERHSLKLPKNLKEAPENYLQLFFAGTKLNYCRHLLFECLYTTLGYMEDRPFTINEVKQFRRELTMLVEAADLIQKKKYPDFMHSQV